MLNLLRRFKGWAVSIAGALAVVVVVMTNVDKFASILAGWLRPWLVASAAIEVVVDPSIKTSVIVALMDGAKALDTKVIKVGQSDTFEPPINGRYAIVWQGVGVKPASVPDILAPRQKLRYRLAFKETGGDGAVLALRLEGDAEDKQSTDPTATALASAAAAQTVRDPAGRPPASNLFPEFERAALVEGLLETGSTNCHGSVTVTQFDASVGCFGLGIPGWLPEVLRQVAVDLPDDFNAAFDAASLAFVRHAIDATTEASSPAQPFLSDQSNRDRLKAALTNMAQWAVFRHHYEIKVLTNYGEAMKIAARIGLHSERGVLLVFDGMSFFGPGRLNRFADQFLARGVADPASDEKTKIAKFAEFMLGSLSGPAKRAAQTRADLIVGGRATRRGISYDLNELGIRDDVAMMAMATR